MSWKSIPALAAAPSGLAASALDPALADGSGMNGVSRLGSMVATAILATVGVEILTILGAAIAVICISIAAGIGIFLDGSSLVGL